jgi:hypothetical protein
VSGLRLWVLLLAGASFLAGLGSGVLLGLSLLPEPTPDRPFADYEQLLVDRFELSSDSVRVEGLQAVLSAYHDDVEALRARELAAIEPGLALLGLTCRRLIRDKVLPPGKREEFDLLASGGVDPLHMPAND